MSDSAFKIRIIFLFLNTELFDFASLSNKIIYILMQFHTSGYIRRQKNPTTKKVINLTLNDLPLTE